jgi:hypothetical protein
MDLGFAGGTAQLTAVPRGDHAHVKVDAIGKLLLARRWSIPVSLVFEVLGERFPTPSLVILDWITRNTGGSILEPQSGTS